MNVREGDVDEWRLDSEISYMLIDRRKSKMNFYI